MTEGIKSHGTILAIGDGASPEVFTTITERFGIPEIGSRGTLIDMSNHDSVANREFLPSELEEGNELTVECNAIPSDAAQELVWTARENKSVDNWKVTFKDTSYCIFPGIVLGAGWDPSELDGRVVFRFVLKIAGTLLRYPYTP